MRKFLSILSLAAAGSAMAQPAPEPVPPPTTPPPTPPTATPPPPPAAEPPVQPDEPKEDKPNAGFDKGFFLRDDDGKYALKINARVQPFYTLARTSGVDAAGTGVPTDYAGAFEVRRARLTLAGNIHSKKLSYKFQTDYGKGFVTLKDFHGDVQLAPKAWLRFGQWKAPFSRQQINSSGALELTDRAVTDKAFGAGRDIGLAVRNDYERSPDGVEWIVGVFNGSGDGSHISSVTTIDPMTGAATTTTSNPTNVPKKFKPAIIGRVGYNHGGIKGYSEGDLEGGSLRYAVAASAWLEGDFDDDKKSNQKAEVDYAVKRSGFSTTGGLYMMTSQDGDGVLDLEKSLIGFHVQAGYMVVPKQVQVAARYAMVDDWTTKDTSTKDQQEISVGGDYYAFGHDAKLAGALRIIKTGEQAFGDNILFELGVNVGF